jgi:hypothetical protein
VWREWRGESQRHRRFDKHVTQSKTPYFDNNGNPCLKESVIVVADILGFTDMVEEAFKCGRQQRVLEHLHQTLGDALRNLRDPSGQKWCYKFFSDNVILGLPVLGGWNGAFEFLQACHCIGHYQREMAVNGYFMRGGISVGPIHISDHLIFSQIIEELWNADKKGEPPRIVLLESAMDYLREHPQINQDLLVESILWDDQDTKYINYLYPLGGAVNEMRQNEMLMHKRHIESNLTKHKDEKTGSNVYEKYVWLARYHNRFCRGNAVYKENSFLVEENWADLGLT